MSIATVVPFAPFETMPARVLRDLAHESAAQMTAAAYEDARRVYLGLSRSTLAQATANRIWWTKVHSWAVTYLTGRLIAAEDHR